MKAWTAINRVLDAALALVLGAMATIVAGNVFCRFVLDFSLSWGDELAQSLLVWLTFLGAAAAMKDRMHYAFDALSRFLPGRLKPWLAAGGMAVTILVSGAVLYWSTVATWAIREWTMPALGVSRAWVYAACPVGCALIIIFAAANLAADLRAARAEVDGP